MPKRPDTIETTVMALEILRRIPRNQFISTSDLHTQLHDAGFERDVRTIQRQLDMLAEHFNIERDTRSKPYGYKWKEIPNGFGIAAMTQQESLLLTLAEQHLHSLLPPSVLKVMDRFFEQARNNLKPHTNAKLEREWLFKVRSVRETLPLLPPKINPEVLEEVSTALYENKWLQIDYKNSLNESKNSRKVMPLGLVQQGHCLYLVCRFDGYDNERNLALHRFQSAQVTTQAFARPKDFDLEKYDDDGRFMFGDGKRTRLRFQIKKSAGKHLLESLLSADQTVKEIGDWYEISATVVDSKQLEWWLNGFGDRVRKVSRSQRSTGV